MTKPAIEPISATGMETEPANRPSPASTRSLPPTEMEPARPTKRGKYARRACDTCQKRKVKCDGASPCFRCTVDKKVCGFGQRWVDSPSQSSHGPAPFVSPQTSPNDANLATGALANEILSRLVRLEGQLQLVQNPQTDRRESFASPDIPSGPNSHPSLIGDHAQTFLGEMSAFHALGSEDAGSTGQHAIDSLQGPISSADKQVNSRTEKSSKGWLSGIMSSRRVVPDRQDFDALLFSYFEFVHTLNPFIHRPWLEQLHENLWAQSFFHSDDDFANNYTKRLSTAIVFLCMASGASQESSRMDPESNTFTAGYSLYSVAMDLLHPFFDLTQDLPISLQSLQALALSSLYLFRLDASEKAEKILAYGISNAHALGLHRQSTYEKMSVYDDQMFRRIWWEFYALDRRISVETGRPLVIQDLNVSTKRPLNLSDEWLELVKDSKATHAEMTNEIDAELSNAACTSIPYLNAMISYGKVVADVWKSLYGESLSPRNQHSVVSDYLDVLIDTNQAKLPAFLKYDPVRTFAEQFSNLQFWQVKHSYLIHMRYDMLKLLIRRSAFVSNGSMTAEDEDPVNQAECVAIATGVVEDYLKIPPEQPRHTFPLVHYLTSAIMIMVSIVLKNPAFKKICRKPILLGVNALIADCSKSWVSGKIMRTISRLTKTVQGGLLNDPNDMTLYQTHSKQWGQSATPHQININDQATLPSVSLSSPPGTSTIAVVDATGYPRTDRPSEHQSSATYSSFQHSAASSSQPKGIDSGYVPVPPTRSPMPNIAASVVQGCPDDDNELFSENASAFIDLPGWVFNDFEFEESMNLSYHDKVTGANSSRYYGGDAWWDPLLVEDIVPFQLPA